MRYCFNHDTVTLQEKTLTWHFKKNDKKGSKAHLEETNDCHLVVSDHRLRLCDLCQGGNSWACALLKPVDDVISLPASCKKIKYIFTVAAATSHFLLHKSNAHVHEMLIMHNTTFVILIHYQTCKGHNLKNSVVFIKLKKCAIYIAMFYVYGLFSVNLAG